MDPTLTVLAYSTLAAAMAALGALPLIGRERIPTASIGWANAVAAGMMFGSAYLLSLAAMRDVPLVGASGAAVGIVFITWTHRALGTDELTLNRLRETSPEYGYKVVLVSTLHAASEGAAIGVAMVESIPFGIFVAVAMAVHNVPEATVLSAVLRSRGVGLGEAAGLAVVANSMQVLLAVATFAVVTAAPTVLPWALGFAVGTLIQLVMLELLPESYQQAGRTSIAAAAVVAMAIVVLVRDLVG